ncbi:hypothetical protein J1614_010342 [Plenodomus biglobosus]|nr:hypothetical protein J1614_010342 [Plenodomus biglobosus]
MNPQPQPACAIPHDLRYYMLRGNDVMVPMVPADQLPFRLPGVPRQLTHQQMFSECWKYLPEPASVSSVSAAQAPSIPTPPPSTAWTKPKFRAPDHQVRNDQFLSDEPVTRPTRWSHSPTVPIDIPSTHRTNPVGTPEKTLSMTEKFAEIYPLEAQRCGYQLRNPSGIEPDSSKKEFCTHWIRTGECDFTAVGCKYKHEMPDLPKLKELGFTQGYPRWWKEKLAIVARGPTWIEQRRAAQSKDEDMDANQIPARREFDPSVFKRRSDMERDTPVDDIRQKRGLLRREAGCERSIQPILSTPVRRDVQPASTILDLLIDLDDTSASLSSPQLSAVSSFSSGSDDTVSSSSSAASALASLTIKAVPISAVGTKTSYKQLNPKLENKTPPRKFPPRRNSEMSCTSTISDETKGRVPATPEPTNPNREQRKATLRVSKHTVEAVKPSYGLGNSKHATISSQTTQNERSNFSKEMHISRQQQQQQQQQNNSGGPPKARGKLSRTRDKARTHPAPTRERVQGTTTRTHGGGRKTAV